MAGYTRVDTSNNIADGNVIAAADLDNEFDGVQSAFNASTGHTHGGAVGEGAPITKLGPTNDVTISASLMAPKTTNTVDLGSSSLRYKDLFLAGNATIGGTLAVTGATTLSAALTYGGVTLSNAVTGTGNMVLSASPTLTGTLSGANASLSGTLAVTGVATLTAQPILSSLTASRAVFTDASKGLVSNAITGTGNVVMSASPTLTGTITADAITASGTVTGNGNWVIGNADTDTITQGASYVTGTQLRSAKVATNTLALAAYDVDGAAYTNLVTLTASNTPTLALTSTGVGTINNMSIGATTASTGAFTTLTTSSTVTLNGGTANGVAYLNGSKVLTTGSALTFDGTKLDVAGVIRSASVSITGAAGGTITPTSDTTNQYTVTALGAPATIAIPSGSPIDGQKLILRFEDNGTGRALTWTTSAGGYRAVGVTLPTTTTATKVTYVGCIYNSQDSFWDVVAVTTQA